jgi:hypothetical protein
VILQKRKEARKHPGLKANVKPICATTLLRSLAPTMMPQTATIAGTTPAPAARAHVLNADAPSVSRKIVARVEGVAVCPRVFDAIRRTAVAAPTFAEPVRLLHKRLACRFGDTKRTCRRCARKQHTSGSSNNCKFLHSISPIGNIYSNSIMIGNSFSRDICRSVAVSISIRGFAASNERTILTL